MKHTYVGLGDSLAFGYSQQLFNENRKTGENPSGFEHGYVSEYYKLINGTLSGYRHRDPRPPCGGALE